MEILTISDLADTENLALFQTVAERVYQDDPVWSPASEMMWQQRLQQLHANPAAIFQPLLAQENNQPVARCLPMLLPESTDDAGNPQGWIGFFEYLKGFEDAAKTMLAHAEDFLRKNGAHSVLTPKSDNQLVGLLTAGFDFPHFVFTNHNPEYYFDFLKECGYLPKTRRITYYFTRNSVKRFKLKLPYLKTREFDRSNLAHEIEVFHFLQSRIFANRSGYIPRSFQEDLRMVQSFLPFLKDEFVIIAETPAGEPVGLLVCIPDIYQRNKNGAIDQARIITIGAIPKYQNKGVGVLMGAHLMENLIKDPQYMRVEGSLILGHNQPVNNLVKRFGAQLGKEYWTLEKPLS